MKNEFQKLEAALTGTDAAKAVDYATFPNAMPSSQEAAPRLGRAYAADTVGQAEVYARMKEMGYQMGEAEAKRVWNALGLIVRDRMPKDGYAYDLGFVRLFPAISGTFPTADAAFDPSRNRLYVAAVPSDEIRDALADGTPTRIDAPSQGDVRVDNVTWGTGTDRDTIKNGEPIDIHGSGLTVGSGDERAELQMPDGSTIPVTLEAPQEAKGIGQRLVGRLAQPADACKGAILMVWTHGFDASDALRATPSHKLTVLAGDAPGPVPLAQTSDGKCKIMSMDDEGSHTDFLYGSAWNVNGTGIYGDRAAPGGEWEIARCSVSVDGSDYTLAGNFDEDGTHGEISPLGGDTPARGTYHDIELSLVASRGTESETLTITLPTFIVE